MQERNEDEFLKLENINVQSSDSCYTLYNPLLYFKTVFFLPLFDIFLGRKSLSDFIQTPITENW